MTTTDIVPEGKFGALPKDALKSELKRRIDWFESSYKFDSETRVESLSGKSERLHIAFGRYRALLEMASQIDQGLFLGGAAA